jgi:hypothetical protein
MKRLALFALVLLPLAGCGPKPAPEPTPPTSAKLPASAGSQQLSYGK